MLRFLAALALLPAAGATRAAALGRASAYDHALGRWGRRLSALMAVAAAAGAEVGELPRSLLEMIDADGDGKIDVEEFIQIAPKDAGDEISEAMRATYARVFKKADIDGDGSLSGREAEYAAFLVAHESVEESPGAKKHLSTAAATIDFSRLDTNNDWKLDKEELGYFIEEHARELGLWSGRGSPEFTEWVDWLFDQADITGDGVLELKEFEHASFLLEHRIAGIAKDVQGGLVKALTHTMFAELDADGDGVIDKEELEAGIQVAAFMPGTHEAQHLLEYLAWAQGVQERVLEAVTPVVDEDVGHDYWVERLRTFIATADINKDGGIDRGEAAGLLRWALRLSAEL